MNIQQMMKQAQKMQKRLEETQQKLAEKLYEGASGGGMAKITVNGKGDIIKVKIDPSLFSSGDVEMLEDLIIAAFNQAKKNADEDSSSLMSQSMSDLGLPPGFKMPF